MLYILLFMISSTSVLYGQDSDVVFTLKKQAINRPEPKVITYYAHTFIGDSLTDNTDSFKLYLLPHAKKFQFQPGRLPFQKGGGLPPVQFTLLNFYQKDSFVCVSIIDSVTGTQNFITSGNTINQYVRNTLDWLSIAKGNLNQPYKYSVCTDTAALLKIGDTTIECYKTESYYKTPWHLGMYREKGHVTYYIAKQTLLPAKLIYESQAIQIHMAIHFSAAERKAFKQKKLYVVTVQNM